MELTSGSNNTPLLNNNLMNVKNKPSTLVSSLLTNKNNKPSLMKKNNQFQNSTNNLHSDYLGIFTSPSSSESSTITNPNLINQNKIEQQKNSIKQKQFQSSNKQIQQEKMKNKNKKIKKIFEQTFDIPKNQQKINKIKMITQKMQENKKKTNKKNQQFTQENKKNQEEILKNKFLNKDKIMTEQQEKMIDAKIKISQTQKQFKKETQKAKEQSGNNQNNKSQAHSNNNKQGLHQQAHLFYQKLKQNKQKKVIHDYVDGKKSYFQNQQQKKINQANDQKETQNKQTLLLSQFIYQNNGHIFTITRGKVPHKNDKFLDIQINQASQSLNDNNGKVYQSEEKLRNRNYTISYRLTITNNNIPKSIKIYFSNISVMYSKMQKYKTSLKLNQSLKKLQFSFIGGDGQIKEIQLNLQEIKTRNNTNSNMGGYQKLKKRNQLLEKELKLLREKLQQRKSQNEKFSTDFKEKYQKQKQTNQQINKELKQLKQKFTTGGNNSAATNQKKQTKDANNMNNINNINNIVNSNVSTNSNVDNLISNNLNVANNAASTKNSNNGGNNTKAQIHPTQKSSTNNHVVEILDLDDDDENIIPQSIQDVQVYKSQSDQYYKQPVAQKITKKPRSKKSANKNHNLDYAYEHQTNQPGKLTHTLNGRTLSVNQILNYKMNEDLLQQGVMRMKYKGRVAGSSAYIDRKQIWQDYSRNVKNQALKSIVQNEKQFTSSKAFVKTGGNLPTMGFMQLFLNVLELDLSDNKIKHIEGLYNLKKLRRLQLNKNQITIIQGLEQNKQLKQLYLRQNRIKSIQNIFHLSKLQSLSLQSNQVVFVNQKIADLKNLKILHLNLNKLQKLPTAFYSMQRLKTVRLFGNPNLNLNQQSHQRLITDMMSKNIGVYCKGNFD